jgi:hypothetical protein
MTELWHRQSDEERYLVAGTPWSLTDYRVYELNAGRIEQEATFEYSNPFIPPNPYASYDPPRIHVQVRTGVYLRYHIRNRQGVWERREVPNQIAIGSRGGSANRRYTWVQIVSPDRDFIRSFDGTESSEYINENELDERVAGNRFDWNGRPWFIDSEDPDSARYSEGARHMRVAGAPNHEVIYDRPGSLSNSAYWLRRHPEGERVTHINHFETYLYDLPLTPFRPPLSIDNPIAAVVWRHRDVAGRRQRVDTPDRLEEHYDIWAIVPNPVVPPGMREAVSRAYHGR